MLRIFLHLSSFKLKKKKKEEKRAEVLGASTEPRFTKHNLEMCVKVIGWRIRMGQVLSRNIIAS